MDPGPMVGRSDASRGDVWGKARATRRDSDQKGRNMGPIGLGKMMGKGMEKIRYIPIRLD